MSPIRKEQEHTNVPDPPPANTARVRFRSWIDAIDQRHYAAINRAVATLAEMPFPPPPP